MATVDQIKKFVFDNCKTREDYNAFVRSLKQIGPAITAWEKASFSMGDKVTFTVTRNGLKFDMVGKIIKINPKTIRVSCDIPGYAKVWNVSPGLLKKAA